MKKITHAPKVIKTVRRNFYVDDVLKSVPKTDQALPLTSDLMKLLREGGFHLTKFDSNSRVLLASIPPTSRANPKLDLDLDQLPLERALGVYWDAQSGNFKFKALQVYKPSTKRGVLSILISLFDPWDFFHPLCSQPRFCYKSCGGRSCLGIKKFQSRIRPSSRSGYKSCRVLLQSRYQGVTRPSASVHKAHVQLHNFSNASTHGHAAVSYLRFVD